MTEKKKTVARPRKKVEKPKVENEIKDESIVLEAVHEVKAHKAVHKPKSNKEPKFYGTGRRKGAIARVFVQAGTGEIIVNNQPFSQYFCGRKALEFKIARPLHTAEVRKSYDVYAKAHGGGIVGQADAVSLGIARALLIVNPDFRSKLKKAGLLSRDPRVKERKKYGLKRARKAFQFSKR